MISSGSSEHISALPESPHNSPAGIPHMASMPPKSQPINMRRVSDSRVPDVASLSPPAVSYNVKDKNF